jgi:hypothetical protein
MDTKSTGGMLHRRQLYFFDWNIVSEYLPTLMARAELSQRAYGRTKESNEEFGSTTLIVRKGRFGNGVESDIHASVWDYESEL